MTAESPEFFHYARLRCAARSRLEGVYRMIAPKKPEAYGSVSVHLVVDGAQRVIDFVKRSIE